VRPPDHQVLGRAPLANTRYGDSPGASRAIPDYRLPGKRQPRQWFTRTPAAARRVSPGSEERPPAGRILARKKAWEQPLQSPADSFRTAPPRGATGRILKATPVPGGPENTVGG